MATFGTSFITISKFWTDFKAVVSSKSLSMQYDETSDAYELFALDGSIAYVSTIYKGTVPSGVVPDYSQAQNDSDKTDFQNNFQSLANQRMTVPVGSVVRATYSAEAALAGANNKNMLCILNPSGSGKVLRIYEVWATVPASSGATVIVPFEIRKTSTLTGGTDVTKQKWDSDDAAAAAAVKHTPTGLTDQGIWYTFVEQTNTAQGSTAAHTEMVHDGENTSGLKPIMLRPGEGLYLKQIANNTSTFRMGVLWTEDTT